MPGDSGVESGTDSGALDTLETLLDVNYDWGYRDTRARLRDLYQRAMGSQWIADEVLPWASEVDPEQPLLPDYLEPLHGSSVAGKLTARERSQLTVETSAWMLSQLLHGEQGALLAAAQLVDQLGAIDEKLCGAAQVVDEARHVDVINRYVQRAYGFAYPINRDLKSLLDLVLGDSRWDMKFLGVQIMIEGLALAALGMIRHTASQPLLRALAHYFMRDEARHVSFGVLILRDHYRAMAEPDVREREDFVYEAAVLMRDRLLFREVWEKQGLPVAECLDITLHNQGQVMFRQLVFGRVIPAIRKIGLLSPRLRQRLTDLGVLQYDSWAAPSAMGRRHWQTIRGQTEPDEADGSDGGH